MPATAGVGSLAAGVVNKAAGLLVMAFGFITVGAIVSVDGVEG